MPFVNPARSLAPALFAGGPALVVVPLYLLAPPVGAVLAALCYELLRDGALHAQSAPADLILSNGKIITVDERFAIAQAVAIRGERIVAVGTTQEIIRLAGPNTRRIDLRGREIEVGHQAGPSLFERGGAGRGQHQFAATNAS